jgi:protein-disulfide isomerase
MKLLREEKVEKRKGKPAASGIISPAMVVVAVVAAVVLALGLIVVTSGGADSLTRLVAGPTAIPTPGPPGAEASMGPKDAKVVITVYADYQCPTCGYFAQAVEPKVIDKYVKTGKARYVYHDWVFIGQESLWAAQAARCAGEQGRFWDYHSKLFASQAGENQGAFALANLKKFAADLGLDTAAFNQCLDSQKYTDAIKADKSEGDEKGVSGTPTVFVNGRLAGKAGYMPRFEDITKLVDEELAK